MSKDAYRQFFALVACVLALVLPGACTPVEKEPPHGTVVLNFRPIAGNEPLVFDELRYRNPGGDGQFRVRAFQLFLSNIRLVGDGVEYIEPESYHLVRFDDEDGVYSIVMENVPKAAYGRIEMSIGVDEAANGSITISGDLDPNSRMAWSWDVGYKFVLFEGVMELDDEQIPLVYHVGFDENYRPLAFSLDEPLFERTSSVDFDVDAMKLFLGTNVVDMVALPSVKFDEDDSSLIAGNYEAMVSLHR